MPLAQRYAAVFAQPVVDATGRRLLDLWYSLGVRLFIGWASPAQTSGRDPVKDRAEQLAWRRAVAALGPDARYVDYPLPEWQVRTVGADGKVVNTGVVAVPTRADLDLMLNDPACLGFFAMDEPNLSPPVGGNVWRTTPAQWADYWRPILDADPNDTKLRVADFAGGKLTGGWEWGYKAADVVPYLTVNDSAGRARRSVDIKLANWHPKNMQAGRYGNDLPAKAVRALGWVGQPDDARGAIVECADELLGKPDGRGPTPAEMWEQYQFVLAERTTTAGGATAEVQPIAVYAFFPQAPKPSAAHRFTNCTPEQLEMCGRIAADFAPRPTPPPPPPPPPPTEIDQLRAELAQVKTDARATSVSLEAARSTIAVQAEQLKDLHARLNRQERRTYSIVPVDPPPPT